MTSQAEYHLTLAKRHVAEGEQRVAYQIALIKRLAAAGKDSSIAQELLKVFEESLRLMRQDLRMILAERAAKT